MLLQEARFFCSCPVQNLSKAIPDFPGSCFTCYAWRTSFIMMFHAHYCAPSFAEVLTAFHYYLAIVVQNDPGTQDCEGPWESSR